MTAFYQDFRVKKLYLFGSLLTDHFDEEKSDIDLLVEFDETGLKPEEIGELFLHFLSALEDLLDKKIDLVRNKHFRNKYFQEELDKTKVLIYEREREKVFA
jgi:predicted nucleotidyltransferase